MVGMVSSSKVPSVIALTSVVLPAFCSPTIAISSYLLKKVPLIQSKILLRKPSIDNNSTECIANHTEQNGKSFVGRTVHSLTLNLLHLQLLS